MKNEAIRLLDAIRAVVPGVTGVEIGTNGNSATVRVTPSNLQVSAQATIDSFSWSDASYAAWAKSRDRDRSKASIDGGDSGSDRIMSRAIALVVLDEINALRANAGLATRTAAQFRSAVKAKIDAGSAD